LCTDNGICTDKLCADIESDRGPRYPFCTDNETLVYSILITFK